MALTRIGRPYRAGRPGVVCFANRMISRQRPEPPGSIDVVNTNASRYQKDADNATPDHR